MKRNPILHTRPIKWIFKKSQGMRFPGIRDVSLYVILEFFVRNTGKSELGLRASALAFTFFLALFPTAIFFFTMLAYLPVKESHDTILLLVAETIPASAYMAIKETLEDILKHQHASLLSIGFLSALYFSSNGFHQLMDLLNKFSHQRETRSFWKQRVISIMLAFFVSFLILFSITLITVGSIVIDYFNKIKFFPHGIVPFLLSGLNYLVSGLIILTVIGAIYFFAPVKSRRWRFFSPGAIFATIVILLTSAGFTFYVNQFNSYNKLYGSIGVLLVIMLLVYINTYIMLLGYELNLAIELARRQEEKNRQRRLGDNKVVFVN